MSYDMTYLKPKNKTILNEEGDTYKIKMKRALIYELDMMSTLSRRAFKALEISIKKGDEDRIWYHIHMLLFTYSSISELLQQIERLSKEIIKTKEFKHLFGSNSGFNIDKDELFDHFGRNLEDWIMNIEGHIIENYIFEKRSVPNLDVKQMLRHFDPNTFELTFRDKTYNLKGEQKRVMHITQNLEEIYRKNLWSI